MNVTRNPLSRGLQQKGKSTNRSEDKDCVLVDFLENVLVIEDVKNIEFQRVHHGLGKPKNMIAELAAERS